MNLLALVSRHKNSGLFLDTNVLLLLLVGSAAPEQISKSKRTAHYSEGDFDLLVQFVAQFAQIFVTPNVLTEVSNFTPSFSEPLRTLYRQKFASWVDTLSEQYVPSKELVHTEAFARVGLADSASISCSARNDSLVLTDDLGLAHALRENGRDVVNFTHLRSWPAWWIAVRETLDAALPQQSFDSPTQPLLVTERRSALPVPRATGEQKASLGACGQHRAGVRQQCSTYFETSGLNRLGCLGRVVFAHPRAGQIQAKCIRLIAFDWLASCKGKNPRLRGPVAVVPQKREFDAQR